MADFWVYSGGLLASVNKVLLKNGGIGKSKSCNHIGALPGFHKGYTNSPNMKDFDGAWRVMTITCCLSLCDDNNYSELDLANGDVWFMKKHLVTRRSKNYSSV